MMMMMMMMICSRTREDGGHNSTAELKHDSATNVDIHLHDSPGVRRCCCEMHRLHCTESGSTETSNCRAAFMCTVIDAVASGTCFVAPVVMFTAVSHKDTPFTIAL